MSENTWPVGAVTFLFSDIEDSTPLWDSHRAAMRPALAEHDDILQTAVESNSGVIIKTTGDGAMAAFSSPSHALAAAIEAQRLLQEEAWPTIVPDKIRVRMGLHTGEAELRAGDYFGTAVNRAARIMAIAHGGQVLLSGTTATLVAEDQQEEITLNDLGEVRLRGLIRPEHVYQLAIAGLPANFPPLRTEAAHSGNLPQQLTTFVGREKEKDEVSHLLSTARLLTLTGPGGTGKTRLSLEVAGDVQDHYAHGVWLVELAPLSDPAGVPAAVASLWGLRGNPATPLEQVLADYLRSKEILLILDNCEHLVTAVARLASDLLSVAPRLTILASSREGLSVPGETTYHLPTLRLPERKISDPRVLLEYESVMLFVERARSVQPGFPLTAENAEAVNHIVRRLDGIPLAIELAAARLRLLPPEQLAGRLDDRFRLLTGGSRSALPRQQTLRALIDWSYDLLDEDERWFLQQMSVFSGGWTLEAAEKIATLDTGFLREETSANDHAQKTRFPEDLDALDLLANLVNKSLVVMEEDEGFARYNFLETIRQYARDRLFESGEGPAARDRHLDFYAQLVLGGVSLDPNATHLTLFSAMGSPEMMDWVARIRPESDNVRAAIEWALQTDPERALAMAINLAPFFMFEGSSLESRPWLEAALLAVEELNQTASEGSPLREKLLLQGRLWKGNLQLGEGHNLEAVETLEGVADEARRLGMSEQLSMALGLQALALAFLGRPETYDIAAEGLAIMKENGERALQGLPLGSMLMAKIQEGDMEAAKALREEIKVLIADSSFINALQIITLARTASRSSDAGDAEALLIQARDMFSRYGDINFYTMIDSEIGHLRRLSGDDASAAAIYRRTIRQWQDLGHQAAVANQLETLAFIASHQERYQRAATLLGAAGALRERLDVDMLPDEQKEYAAEMSALHAAMDPGTLEAAWQAGRGMDLDTAVTYAISP